MVMKTANNKSSSSQFGLNLSAETWDDNYALVWKQEGGNVYTVNEPHLPGGFGKLGFINNRAFIYQVETKELGPHLFMVGLPGASCISKVQKIEKDTGLSLLVIATSGDSHHMAMKSWLEVYPKATFVMSSVKWPTTRNGSSILADPTWKKQVILTDGNTFPPILEAYSETVQFVGFNQCLVIGDKPYMSSDNKNPTKHQGFGYLKKVAGETCDTPFLCIWSYHVPSKTLAYEHNFQMFINKELKKDMTLLGKIAMPTEVFGSCGKGPFPVLPSDPDAARSHCQSMAKILQLDVRAMLDFHVGCGRMVRNFASSKEFQKEMQQVLHKTGEDDPSGESLVQYMTGNSYFCC